MNTANILSTIKNSNLSNEEKTFAIANVAGTLTPKINRKVAIMQKMLMAMPLEQPIRIMDIQPKLETEKVYYTNQKLSSLMRYLVAMGAVRKEVTSTGKSIIVNNNSNRPIEVSEKITVFTRII